MGPGGSQITCITVCSGYCKLDTTGNHTYEILQAIMSPHVKFLKRFPLKWLYLLNAMGHGLAM